MIDFLIGVATGFFIAIMFAVILDMRRESIERTK